MERDTCGCAVERKYASDYLLRRLYQGKGKKRLGKVEVEGRKVELYLSDSKLTYVSTECPIAVITMERLCQVFNENGKLSLEEAVHALEEIKGFTVSQLSREIAREVVRVLEESGIHS
ncbi:MAG: hypothetical protein TQ35_0009205 [Candidatus Aramenus sulfurataquae]|jgi:hypothetical protein|uniref:Uncharacterized protein n=2 Tax=Candidatus Aramenus sulfurataquae TaxID=1326980 RepID=A0A0F2LMH4_9CREN